MAKNLGFRGWFYFRQGWSTYFAFIFAAINTLTVTYYLAIERIPALQVVFPNFVQYVIIISSIGVPLLVTIGYVHFKKTKARRAEIDIGQETNPYMVRILLNSELSLKLNLKLLEKTIKLSKSEQLTKEELHELEELQNEFSKFVNERKFGAKMELDFFKKFGNF